MSNPTLTIIGRVATEPEYRNFGNSTVVKFRVLTSDRRKDEDGNWQDVNTSGWNISAWNTLADSCKNILQKGQELVIMGAIKEDAWTDKEGNNRKTVEITASNIAVSTYSIQRAAKSSPEPVAAGGTNIASWDETF
jgi:single-strand DNA-binding protein